MNDTAVLNEAILSDDVVDLQGSGLKVAQWNSAAILQQPGLNQSTRFMQNETGEQRLFA